LPRFPRLPGGPGAPEVEKKSKTKLKHLINVQKYLCVNFFLHNLFKSLLKRLNEIYFGKARERDKKLFTFSTRALAKFFGDDLVMEIICKFLALIQTNRKKFFYSTKMNKI
jgi:hypothetical protein